MRSYLYIVFCLLFKFTVSQNSNDTSRINQSIKAINKQLEENVDKALELISSEIKFAEKIKYTLGFAKLNSQLVKYYELKGYTDSVLLFSPKNIKFARASKDTNLIINCYLTYARSFSIAGKFHDAISQCLIAQQFAENQNNYKIKIKVLHDLAFIYDNLNSHQKALDYYKKALTISYSVKDTFNIANLSARIGGEFNYLLKYDSALFYNLQSLKYFNYINHKRGKGVALTNLSSVYADLKQYDKAILTANEALKIREELNDTYAIIILNNNLALTNCELKLYNVALKHALKAEQLLKSSDDENMHIQNTSVLSSIYFKLNDLKKAYEYRTLHSNKLQNKYNATNVKALSELQTKYETEKKEKEIEMLQMKNKSENEKAILEKNKRNNIIIFISFILVIIIIFSLMLFKRFKITEQQKITIQKQKLLVDEKAADLAARQKEILDSINYAKRIQQAHLPSEVYISKHINK